MFTTVKRDLDKAKFTLIYLTKDAVCQFKSVGLYKVYFIFSFIIVTTPPLKLAVLFCQTV